MPVVGRRTLVDPGFKTRYQTASTSSASASTSANADPAALPSEVRDLINRYAQENPVPTGAPGEAHEENVRQWTQRLAQYVDRERPGEGWGLKRADSGRPVGKDTLARQVDGRLYAWDLLIGTGTGQPTLADSPQWHDVTGQVFVSSSGTNAGGTALGGPAGSGRGTGLGSVLSGPGSRPRNGQPATGQAVLRDEVLGRNQGEAFGLASLAADRQRKKTAHAPGRQSTILGGFASASRPATRRTTALGY